MEPATRSDPDPTSEATDVVGELKRLRQREGLKANRIKGDCPHLRDLGQTIAKREAEYRDSTPEAVAVKLVREGLTKIASSDSVDPDKAGALRAALRLDPIYKQGLLKDRREAFGKDHGSRGRDTVTNWEDEALLVLADWLVARVSGAPGEASLVQPTEPGDTSEFRIVTHDTSVVLTDQQTLADMVVVREAEATKEDAAVVCVRATYYDDPLTEAFALQPLANCRLLEAEWSAGWYEARLVLPKTSLGTRVRFSYRFAVASTVPVRPLINITSQADGGSAVTRVQFTEGALPSAIWAYHGCAETLMPHSVDAANALPLKLNNVNYAEDRATNLKYGLVYGISWKW